MVVTCPCCFARFAIEAALTDDDARRAVAAALKMPAPLGELVLRYIGLFRPAKRALAWDRAAALIDALLLPIQAGRVERHGRVWAAPLDAWRAALTEMLDRRDKLQLPLKSHGYLFEIVTAQANKTEARIEQDAEDQKHRRAHRDSGTPVPAGEVLQRMSEPPKKGPPRDLDKIESHLRNLKDKIK